MIRALVLALSLAAPAGAAEIGPEALDALRADIVVLGEVHDNPAHHLNQARAVAALRPAALVFEMLTRDQAARATDTARADADTLGAALGWAEAGWPDFAMYWPIFGAAPEAEIRGAAVPRGEARRVFEAPLAEVFGAGAARYGLDRPLPEAQQATREAEQMAAHCDALPGDMLPGMVAAQRLRDAVLADAALAALRDTGGPVAVITGSGHARTDYGVPAKLALAAPDVTVLSLGQLERPAGADQPFDLWIVTDAAPREDPCAAFRG